jgi:tetratricopeptide (TPR) repeat protein
MLRLLIVLALLPAAAVAGEETVSFQTLGEDGEVVTGKVVELQVEGVLLEAEKATRRVPWAKIHPADRYRLRASVTPEKADARLRLAEQCLDEAYYEGARKELEKALALGHRDGKKIDELSEAVEHRECEGFYARFLEALDRQEYDEALEVVRRMAMRFPNRRLTGEARQMTSKILRARDEAKAQAERDAKAAAEDQKEARRRAWIDARFTEAENAIRRGKKAKVSAEHYHARGNLTRSRKGYEEAERQFLLARRILLRLRRATRSGPDFDRADHETRSVERRLLEVYLGLARMYVDNRNFKRGILYVDRALLFDPVNPEALRMADYIRRNWIRRSLRGITNSPGVIVR